MKLIEKKPAHTNTLFQSGDSIYVCTDSGGYDLAYADDKTICEVVLEWAKWRRKQDKIANDRKTKIKPVR